MTDQEFERALGAFRTSVRAVGAEEMTAARTSGLLPRPALTAVWSLVAILVFALCSLRNPPATPPAEASIDQDTALMADVSVEIARPAPRGMEPLLP